MPYFLVWLIEMPKQGRKTPLPVPVTASDIQKNARMVPAAYGKKAQLAAAAAAKVYVDAPFQKWSEWPAAQQAGEHLQDIDEFLPVPPSRYSYEPQHTRATNWSSRTGYRFLSGGSTAPQKKHLEITVGLRPRGKTPFAVIAYPGTDMIDIRDWATNLNIKSWTPLKKLNDAYAGTQFANKGIHAGFASRYMQSKPALLRGLEALKTTNGERLPSEVVVTGHSLGGALAQIAAFDLQMMYPDTRFTTYVFEAPPIGQKGLNRAWKSKKHYNFFFENSPVGDLQRGLQKSGMQSVLALVSRDLVDPSKRAPLALTSEVQRQQAAQWAEIKERTGEVLRKATTDARKAVVPAAASFILDRVPGIRRIPKKLKMVAIEAVGLGAAPEIADTAVDMGTALAGLAMQSASTGAANWVGLHNMEHALKGLVHSGIEARKLPIQTGEDDAWTWTMSFFSRDSSEFGSARSSFSSAEVAAIRDIASSGGGEVPARMRVKRTRDGSVRPAHWVPHGDNQLNNEMPAAPSSVHMASVTSEGLSADRPSSARVLRRRLNPASTERSGAAQRVFRKRLLKAR